ncbi:hypothetical protein ACFRAQ_34915 [Nocardia sp. NPDC056611]|uniref:hypothetical protein n=1 Tax=Nocardia sp. NPDC056611 TaxID=3345877 RepID=UPI00366ACAAF
MTEHMATHAVVMPADMFGPGKELGRGTLGECRQALFSGAIYYRNDEFRTELSEDRTFLRVIKRATDEVEIERHVIALNI